MSIGELPSGGRRPGCASPARGRCASAFAVRAAASRPKGASTKALRNASPPASRARAPLRGLASIQSCGQLLDCCVVEKIDGGDRCQLEAPEGDIGVDVVRRKASMAPRAYAGTPAAYPPVIRAV